MANFEIPENPEYTEKIRKFEEEDPGHADLFNDVVQALLSNEVFLKKMADTLANRISGLNNLTKYTTTKVSNPTVGPQIAQIESTDFDLETGNPIPFPIQDVVAGHEKALNQLNTDMNDMLKIEIIYLGISDNTKVGVWHNISNKNLKDYAYLAFVPYNANTGIYNSPIMIPIVLFNNVGNTISNPIKINFDDASVICYIAADINRVAVYLSSGNANLHVYAIK